MLAQKRDLIGLGIEEVEVRFACIDVLIDIFAGHVMREERAFHRDELGSDVAFCILMDADQSQPCIRRWQPGEGRHEDAGFFVDIIDLRAGVSIQAYHSEEQLTVCSCNRSCDVASQLIAVKVSKFCYE